MVTETMFVSPGDVNGQIAELNSHIEKIKSRRSELHGQIVTASLALDSDRVKELQADIQSLDLEWLSLNQRIETLELRKTTVDAEWQSELKSRDIARYEELTAQLGRECNALSSAEAEVSKATIEFVKTVNNWKIQRDKVISTQNGLTELKQRHGLEPYESPDNPPTIDWSTVKVGKTSVPVMKVCEDLCFRYTQQGRNSRRFSPFKHWPGIIRDIFGG